MGLQNEKATSPTNSPYGGISFIVEIGRWRNGRRVTRPKANGCHRAYFICFGRVESLTGVTALIFVLPAKIRDLRLK